MAFIVKSLPTLDKLGIAASSLENVDAKKIATEWFSQFSKHASEGNVAQVASLLSEDALWRDVLSLTWDFRTFQGDAVQQFLVDRLPHVGMSNFQLNERYVHLGRPYPDLVWIQAMFTFETTVGLCSGVFRLIPQPNGGAWKAHCLFTTLEDLKGFPEKIGSFRNTAPNHGKWEEERRRATSFASSDPTVLIVGAGQSGLELAARLKALDVSVLVLEKNPRVGDNWRNRYEALCLHDPVWYDHMPYLPFPPQWPVYTPAKKLANWLESYAEALELPVWTSAEVKSATTNDLGMWRVTIGRDGQDRVFNVKHLVFATGFGSYRGRLPTYPGMETFQGQILHSSQHKKATDHTGKKVVVIGACTSAHDLCADYYEHGIDVTMYQRSSTYVMTTSRGLPILFDGVYSENAPPVEVADRFNASYPNALVGLMAPRMVAKLAEADKELLDGLRQRGFRLNNGYKDCGFSLAVWEHAGGYYLDVGTSQLIVDGKIKLKNDAQIAHFTPTGLAFTNGSELPADVVVFATGVGDVKDNIRKVCGDEIGNRCKPIWGLDAEGEIRGCWRDLGIPGLWYMMGNLAYCRFHSKHVALQIKAMEEKVFGPERYSLR
uniref:FAD/NAD(P)-binding domain-containing protein n=1 Tax=Mycena chlorophos TaxID=658473 RepID=A0ABQ0M4L3_MYCCL|nr:predicted protein [Mycena chlorophos]